MLLGMNDRIIMKASVPVFVANSLGAQERHVGGVKRFFVIPSGGACNAEAFLCTLLEVCGGAFFPFGIVAACLANQTKPL